MVTLFLLFGAAEGAIAQNSGDGTQFSTPDAIRFPTPDVIACLKAIEPLDSRYRGWMESQCVGIAGDICLNVDKGRRGCLHDLVASMREFYEKLMPLLPSTIDGGGFTAYGYARALVQAADTFENLPECDGLRVYEYSICEFVSLGTATQDLFYRARQAEVELP
ncbi:hypothetical protein KIN_22990 [Litoreibacter roseus]|uniref:Uncharacterized protein n=2 Tax=Litoreibacter roseus TaxID=2601869 RepID=A0A6N6JGH4_9RHOB|nr:hypothetical protein KIN_22990 [Litoreibacter roseus]